MDRLQIQKEIRAVIERCLFKDHLDPNAELKTGIKTLYSKHQTPLKVET